MQPTCSQALAVGGVCVIGVRADYRMFGWSQTNSDARVDGYTITDTEIKYCNGII